MDKYRTGQTSKYIRNSLCILIGVVAGSISVLLHKLSLDDLITQHYLPAIICFVITGSILLLLSEQRPCVCRIRQTLSAVALAAICSIPLSLTTTQGMLGYYGVLYVIMLYVAVCLHILYFSATKTKNSYEEYHQISWNNCILILTSLFFSGLVFLILYLWAELFNSIKISFFDVLFSNMYFKLFVWPFLIAVSFCFSLSMKDTMYRIRELLLRFFSLLIPMVAFIGGVFVITLLVKALIGAIALASNDSIETIITTSFAILSLITINATYDNGKKTEALSKINRISLYITMSLLPIFCMLSLFTWIHSLSHTSPIINKDTLPHLVTITLILCYGIGYTIGAINPAHRLRTIEKTNRVMAWIVIIMIYLISTPLIQFVPDKITARHLMPNKHNQTQKIMKRQEKLFALAGITWSKDHDQYHKPIVLGYLNKVPFWGCRLQYDNQPYVGVVIRTQCVSISGGNQIKNNEFQYLTGQPEGIHWTRPYSGDPILAANKTGRTMLCRSIVDNHIAIGVSESNRLCRLLTTTKEDIVNTNYFQLASIKYKKN